MLISRNGSNHSENMNWTIPSLSVLHQQADIVTAAAALRGPADTPMAETEVAPIMAA